MQRPGITSTHLQRHRFIDKLQRHVQFVEWGLTPYDYGLLATGFIDVIATTGPILHDLAPLDPVIRNAGGAVLDWHGQPLTLSSPNHVIAVGDPLLADSVLNIVKPAVSE